MRVDALVRMGKTELAVAGTFTLAGYVDSRQTARIHLDDLGLWGRVLVPVHEATKLGFGNLDFVWNVKRAALKEAPLQRSLDGSWRTAVDGMSQFCLPGGDRVDVAVRMTLRLVLAADEASLTSKEDQSIGCTLTVQIAVIDSSVTYSQRRRGDDDSHTFAGPVTLGSRIMEIARRAAAYFAARRAPPISLFGAGGRLVAIAWGYRARYITLDPIFVVDRQSHGGYEPSFDFFAAALAGARVVWEKVGVEIRNCPPRYVDISDFAMEVVNGVDGETLLRRHGGIDLSPADQRMDGLVEAMLARYGETPNVYPVYYFRSLNQGELYGSTKNGGQPSAYIITQTNVNPRNINNVGIEHDRYQIPRFHLGHELGHLMGLNGHPGLEDSDDRRGRGSGQTIMCPLPTPSAIRAKNSAFNGAGLVLTSNFVASDPPRFRPDCTDDVRNRVDEIERESDQTLGSCGPETCDVV